MKFLRGDTFFAKWAIPLLPTSHMPEMPDAMYEKLFETDVGSDRLESDNGVEDGLESAQEVKTGNVKPFPHEYPAVFTQELLSVFHTDVLIDFAPQSGQKLLAALMLNLRAVGICKSVQHKKFILGNLIDIVKAKKMIPGYTSLPKPAELLAYENKLKQKPAMISPIKPSQPTTPATPTPPAEGAATVTPARVVTPVVPSPSTTTPVAPGSLLHAFGSVSM